MTNTINDGGPAFPSVEYADENGHYDGIYPIRSQYCGISMRDYFAAKFAAAWTIALSSRWKEEGCDDRAIANEAARLGLWQAEAMLSIIPRSST